jgi:hypothetical protein
MSALQRFVLKFIVLAAMLLGLPLIGAWIAGIPIGQYLEFPPRTRYVQHAPFSWPAFFIFVLLIAASVLVPVIRGIQSFRKPSLPRNTFDNRPFAWWGWMGVITGIVAWILAWTRFSWFDDFQPYTFSPLWFSYILVINALCLCRTGRCLMTDRPGYFLLLFPSSAVFWWFFEYLNRFVQNWYYVGVEFSPWSYFWSATLPFSTVLPAVLSTRQLLLDTGWTKPSFERIRPIKPSRPIPVAVGLLLLSAACLAGIGVLPDYLFPFLWVSPFLIIICLQTMMKERHIFSEMAAGDWSGAAAASLAALICGVFWEMWNYYSLAKWQYNIPLVHRFLIFEMPMLGYAGYIPFGLECVAIGDMLESLLHRVSGFNGSEVQD